MGLGVSGKAACRLLHHFGKSVLATDSRDSVNTQGLPADIEVVLGTNDPGDATVAVLSPSLNPRWPENRDKPALQPIWERARTGSLTLVSEVELGIQAFPGKVLAVGGTDGKSTTAAFLAHLFREIGVPTLLGGNSWQAISSVVLEQLDAVEPAECAVVEISAFQLWDGHNVRPDVAILTNVALDHLDHFESLDDYVSAKRELVRHAGEGMTVVLNSEDERLMIWAGEVRRAGAAVATFGEDADLRVENDRLVWRDAHNPQEIPLVGFPLPGLHNRRNLAAAYLAADAIGELRGVDTEQLTTAARSFRGLPHRIEFVREYRGTRFFNDSKATNVHAACVAFRAMERPVVAIIGGVDKKLELDPLIDVLSTNAREVIVIGQLRERFTREAAERGLDVWHAKSLEEAVERAQELADAEIDVLFSPACSSFDMFRSFEHRGEEFARLVRELETPNRKGT